MSTDVIYATNIPDGGATRANSTYATARSGGTKFAAPGGNFTNVGQEYYSGNYTIRESFLQFNTSTIGSDAVSSAVLSAYCYSKNITGSAFTVNARIYNWGASLDTGDYIAGASLTGNTLVAHLATGSFTTSAYNNLTNDAFPANINGAGTTYVVLDSSRVEAGNTPTAFEEIGIRMASSTGGTNTPYLTITHTASGSPI